MVFGEALYLPRTATRAEQRALDYALVERMSHLMEAQPCHITAGILYNRALHGRTERLGFEGESHPLMAKARPRAVREEVSRSLSLFAHKGLIQMHGDSIDIRPGAMLNHPGPEYPFRKQHPVRFLVNQVLHLPGLVDAIEHAARECR